MATSKTVVVWDDIWKKISDSTESPLGAAAPTLEEPLTIFVTTTGNDSGFGTLSSPYATVQKAIDYLKPFNIRSAVTISLGAGTFAPFVVEGLTFSGAGSLKIVGTYTVTYTGTVTSTAAIFSNVAHQQLTDTGAAFSVDGVASLILRSVNPTTPTNRYRVAVTNTATTIDYMGTATGTLGAGAQYEVLTLNTIIANTQAASGIHFGVNTNPAFPIGNSSAALNYRITLETVEIQCNSPGVANTNGTGGISSNGGSFVMDGCRVIGGNASLSPTPLVFINTNSLIQACHVFERRPGGGVGNTTFNISRGGAGLTVMSQCYIKKVTNTSYTAILGVAPFQLTTTCIEGFAVGLNYDAASLMFSTTSLWLRGCATGVVCSGRMPILAAEITGATTGISVLDGGHIVSFFAGTITATTGISATRGGKCQIVSTATITATNELSVDGVVVTLATMRAASPRITPTTPNVYGSYIYE